LIFSFETQLNEEILTKIEWIFFKKIMSDKSIGKVLKEFFPKSSKIDWKKIATLETNGKDSLQFLSWRGKDDILFLPYYDAEDVVNLDYLSRFQTPAAKNSFSGPRSWVNLPAISVNDEKTANEISLNHLSLGADGILFDLRKHANANLDQLMSKIEWPHCFVAFRANETFFLDPLSSFIKNKFDPASVSGALFWESIPKKNNLDFYFNYCTHFKALGLIIPHASPAFEMSEALSEGVKTFETLSGKSNPENIFKSISFSLSTDASFVESIAKLKALRMLWFQVAHAYGFNDYKVADLHLHARIEMKMDEKFAPHENMLKGTFASMAAILGGCDSLTVHTNDQAIMLRLARNVSAILREESFLNKVADPVDGAYALDAVMNEIAQKAWVLFQLKSRPS
jgi:methylmalonyl-CoA mutase